jgi:hypothetical protein
MYGALFAFVLAVSIITGPYGIDYGQFPPRVVDMRDLTGTP